MKQKKYLILAIARLFTSTSFGQKDGYSVNEQKELNLFFEFKNYIVNSINQKADLVILRIWITCFNISFLLILKGIR